MTSGSQELDTKGNNIEQAQVRRLLRKNQKLCRESGIWVYTVL